MHLCRVAPASSNCTIKSDDNIQKNTHNRYRSDCSIKRYGTDIPQGRCPEGDATVCASMKQGRGLVGYFNYTLRLNIYKFIH